MDEMDILFSTLDESEAEKLLCSISAEADPIVSAKIKAKLGIEEKSKIKALPITKVILPFAAVLCVILSCTIALGVKNHRIPSVTTTAPVITEPAPQDNPLMFAISSGNDDIIQKLLTVPGVITKETLDFALNFSNTLSYNTIHSIAVSVRDALGSTGLDSLVESALLGDSQSALRELKARENMTMTPFEKLAFFFAVAFCDSEVVEEFINRGYDIYTKDSSGNSIYAVAEKYGNEDTMNYAVAHGITQ